MRAYGLCVVLLAFAGASHAAVTRTAVPCGDPPAAASLANSRCMSVQVPLSHQQPEGPSIDLFVRRIPATGSAPHRGEVWLLSGGPGEAGASLYPMIAVYQRAFPGFDLIIPDHRGTGRSARICTKEESPDSAAGTGLAGAEWGSCIGTMYADPQRTGAFRITEAAQDVGHLLSQLRGEGEVVVYGVSYGTQLALRMLQVAPVPLDALVLDGLVPTETSQQWDLSRRTALVDAVGRQVLGDARVPVLKQLLQQPDSAPWRAQVPGGDLRRYFGVLLSFPALRDRIPQLVDDLARGDDASLKQSAHDLTAALAAMGQGGNNQPSLPLVMLIAASENNARPKLTQATVNEEAADALFVSTIPGLLVDSPVPAYAKDAWFGKQPGQIPRTLVLQGTLDPNTSYEGAREHAALLSSAGPLTFHSVDRGAHLLAFAAPKCFAEATAAFLAGQVVPARCSER